jgi:hypothetical protein
MTITDLSRAHRAEHQLTLFLSLFCSGTLGHQGDAA